MIDDEMNHYYIFLCIQVLDIMVEGIFINWINNGEINHFYIIMIMYSGYRYYGGGYFH